MLSKTKLVTIPSTLGAVFAVSMLAISPVKAEVNPFHMQSLSEGMFVADTHSKSKKEKFGKMDTNNDAQISKDEFLAYAEKKFAKKDTDGDGVLSKKERIIESETFDEKEPSR